MSNSKANTCQIVLGTTSMEYTREPIANNSTELIPKVQIVVVTPIKIATKPAGAKPNEWGYRFETMVQVDVLLSDGNHFVFELQEVTNQSGWTGDLSGQQQCVNDINAWL